MRASIRVFPFLLLALLALLAGLWAGLLRLGWTLPPFLNGTAANHGALMVSGFLGTLIALERVIALKQRWMIAAPLLTGTGWLVGLIIPSGLPGPALLTLGSLATVAILTVILRRELKIYTTIMWLGTLSWLIGNLFWTAGWPVYRVIPWWTAFLVLTIGGERLELSRVLRPTRQQHLLFALAVAAFLAGVVLSIFVPAAGWRLAGLGMIATAAWLVRYDIARRNLRHPVPLTRFIAACLFLGYLWLATGGVLYLVFGFQPAGFYYDAMLHSVFIGFVLSMIFGHAPIILPALLGIMIAYRPVMTFNLVLLHLSLIIRIAGDLSLSSALRMWGGLINEVAVLLFLGTMIYTLKGSGRKSRGA